MVYLLLAVVASVIQLAVGVGVGVWLRKERASPPTDPPALAAAPANSVQPPRQEEGQPADWLQTLEKIREALDNHTSRREIEPDVPDAPLEAKTAPSTAPAPTSAPPASQEQKRAPAPFAPSSLPLTTNALGVVPAPEIRGSDRRTTVRRSFRHKQYVAPYHGGCLPSRVSFREVICQDVSATGFSFLSPQLPDFDSLVVALGVEPNLTYMTARVINRVPVGSNAAPLYRIGCRFSGRLS